MTEVGFYHLTSTELPRALAQLLGRILDSGARAVVLCGSEERVTALDTALWTMDRPDWLPHGAPHSGHADLQPVWLTTVDENPNGATFLVLLDGCVSAHMGAFTRVLDIFDGNDEPAVEAARQRWKDAKAAGYALAYWRQSDRGWEKAA